MTTLILPLGHEFIGVAGHDDDNECTHREDGTDATYCSEPAEEHAPREPIYCTAQTYRQTRDNPAEYCENEVSEEGELCDSHDSDARMDDDYDRYLQSRDD